MDLIQIERTDRLQRFDILSTNLNASDSKRALISSLHRKQISVLI